jgi:hypothetical protein
MNYSEFEPELINNAQVIYLKYLAIKNYFSKDYDYFKYQGTVSRNFLSGFERKKELYVCINLHRKYGNLEQIEKLFVLNFLKNSNTWMGSLNYNVLTDFEKFSQSSEYSFKREVKPIFKEGKYNEKFNVSKEFSYTEVFDMYEKGLVKMETLIILNIVTRFLDLVYEGHNDFIFETEYKKIQKYQKFLEKWETFDILNFKKVIKNLISDSKQTIE